MSKEKPQTKLDEAGRVAAVLNAAGRASRMAKHLPDKFRKQLAELCNPEGVAVPLVRDQAIAILRQAGQENKATVDGLTEDKS